MQLWVGLGNPGAEYALQRHNVGFMAIDAIAEAHGFGAPSKKFSGLFCEGRISNERIALLKPQTFMNESGRAVRAALDFFKLGLDSVTVFHDELDLAPLRVRAKLGGGTAGHNGLRSIATHCGAEFHRVRIGIGHPGHKDQVTPYVLGNFAKTEMAAVAAVLGAIAAAAGWLAAGDPARFISDIALRVADGG